MKFGNLFDIVIQHWCFHVLILNTCLCRMFVYLHSDLKTVLILKKGLLSVFSHFSTAGLFKMTSQSFTIFFFFFIFLDLFECILGEAFCSVPGSWQKELPLVVRRNSYLYPSCKLLLCPLAVGCWLCLHLLVGAKK